MKYVFTNGTAEQKELWAAAYGLLRNLPEESLPLQITITFANPSEIGQTSFATTTWSYHSEISQTAVRNDAPGYGGADAGLIAEAAAMGLTYDAHQHFNETAIHELGHSVFAALPESTRVAIARLFGAKSDNEGELNPADRPWQDRIMEAIAETFKEAFLPARYRVFPNRTNIHLSYALYPTFRRLIRDGLTEIEPGEPLGPGEVEIPPYNVDIFAQGEPTFFEEGSGAHWANPMKGIEGKRGLWQSSFGNTENAAHNSQLNHNSEWEGWVLDGTIIAFKIHIPLIAFDPSIMGNPYILPEAVLQTVNDVSVMFAVFVRKSRFAAETMHTRAYWSLTAITKKQFEENAGFHPEAEWIDPNWVITEAARGGGAPPTDLFGSVVVNSTNFTETRKCHGQTYRRVWIYGQVSSQMCLQWPETEKEQERLRQGTTYHYIPSLEFKQPGCGSEEPGVPVVIPIGGVEAFGARAGKVVRRHRVSGQLGSI